MECLHSRLIWQSIGYREQWIQAVGKEVTHLELKAVFSLFDKSSGSGGGGGGGGGSGRSGADHHRSGDHRGSRSTGGSGGSGGGGHRGSRH